MRDRMNSHWSYGGRRGMQQLRPLGSSSPGSSRTSLSSLWATQSIVLWVNPHKPHPLCKIIRPLLEKHSPQREAAEVSSPQQPSQQRNIQKMPGGQHRDRWTHKKRMSFFPRAVYSESFNVTRWHREVLIEPILYFSFNTMITSAFFSVSSSGNKHIPRILGVD